MKIRVNLFGAPGAGKSSLAAHIFAKAKINGLSMELVSEQAKYHTWIKDEIGIASQLWLAGAQEYRERVGLQAPHGIITDSPMILAAFWAERRGYKKSVVKGIVDAADHCRFYTIVDINLFVELDRDRYDVAGRNQSRETSLLLEEELKTFLTKKKVITSSVNRTEADGVSRQVITEIREIFHAYDR